VAAQATTRAAVDRAVTTGKALRVVLASFSNETRGSIVLLQMKEELVLGGREIQEGSAGIGWFRADLSHSDARNRSRQVSADCDLIAQGYNRNSL
jgi:hypothetical protein